MADPEDIARIRAYLEHHRHTYDREALRQKLLADGHDPQTVDLAIAQVYGFQVKATTPPAPIGTTTRVVLTGVGVFLFNYVTLPLITVVLSRTNASLTVGLVALLAVLVSEGIVAAVLWRSQRAIARGIAWGIAATLLPIALLALLFGICVALIGGL